MEYLTGKEIKENPGKLKSIYADYVGRNTRDFFAADLVAKYHDRFFPDRAATKILDYGVAGGLFPGQLHERGFRNVYGSDIDDYLSEENKKFIKEFKTADLSYDKIPWPDNYFDIVTAWCVLPHLENPHHAVRETLRILKPGGLFILSIPHLGSKTSINFFLEHGDFARYYPGKNHISVFTPGVFQTSVLRYFKKVEMEYLIDQRILAGPKGWLRKKILSWTARFGKLGNYFRELWGYNQIWILQK